MSATSRRIDDLNRLLPSLLYGPLSPRHRADLLEMLRLTWSDYHPRWCTSTFPMPASRRAERLHLRYARLTLLTTLAPGEPRYDIPVEVWGDCTITVHLDRSYGLARGKTTQRPIQVRDTSGAILLLITSMLGQIGTTFHCRCAHRPTPDAPPCARFFLAFPTRYRQVLCSRHAPRRRG